MMKRLGYTLVEMMVSLGVFSTVSLGIIQGAMVLGKNIELTREYNNCRSDLSVFVQSLYSFGNKSYGAYFYDVDNEFDASSKYFDYLTNYTPSIKTNTMFNSLFLMKVSSGADIDQDGELIYSPDDKTISWIKQIGGDAEVILEGVYRIDYEDDSNEGEEPIFKLPHSSSHYNVNYTPDAPKLFVMEFKKQVMEPDSEKQDRIMIPVKFMIQLNTIN